MPVPIPITPLLDHVPTIVRAHRLHVDLRRIAPGLHVPAHNVNAATTNPLVWALIGIAIGVTLLGLAALAATRRATHP